MDLFFQQLVNGLALGATYAVVAIGFGLVFSVMRVINLAHPELFMLGAYTTVVVASLLGSSPPPIILIMVMLIAGVAVSASVAVAIERLILRPLRRSYILIPFIATAGASIVLQNVVERFFGADPIRAPSVIPRVLLTIGSVHFTLTQLFVLVAALAVMVGISWYVRRTKWGLATRAIAERPDQASASGVNVNAVARLTLAISGASAGIAGVTVGLLLQAASPSMGLVFGTKSFIAMLVAGNRHIEGVMVVGIALGIVEALVAGYISSTYRDAVAFALLLAILFFRPRGIFGSYED